MKRKKIIPQDKLLNSLYKEYASMYNIQTDVIKECINRAMQKTFDSKLPVVFNSMSNITITKIDNSGTYKTKNIVISDIKQKEFTTNLTSIITNIKLKEFNKILRTTLDINTNIFYGKYIETKQDKAMFQLFDKEKNKINNTLAAIPINEAITSNDSLNLIAIHLNYYPSQKNGMFIMQGTMRSERIIKIIVSSALKKIGNVVNKKYSFSNILITKDWKIIVKLNNHFIEKVVVEELTNYIKVKLNLDAKFITKKLEKGDVKVETR